MTLPLAWGKFYFPMECVKVCLHMANDIVEAIMYYYALNFNEQGWIQPDALDYESFTINRNAYYFAVADASLLFSLPKAYNECQKLAHPNN